MRICLYGKHVFCDPTCVHHRRSGFKPLDLFLSFFCNFIRFGFFLVALAKVTC